MKFITLISASILVFTCLFGCTKSSLKPTVFDVFVDDSRAVFGRGNKLVVLRLSPEKVESSILFEANQSIVSVAKSKHSQLIAVGVSDETKCKTVILDEQLNEQKSISASPCFPIWWIDRDNLLLIIGDEFRSERKITKYRFVGARFATLNVKTLKMVPGPKVIPIDDWYAYGICSLNDIYVIDGSNLDNHRIKSVRTGRSADFGSQNAYYYRIQCGRKGYGLRDDSRSNNYDLVTFDFDLKKQTVVLPKDKLNSMFESR